MLNVENIYVCFNNLDTVIIIKLIEYLLISLCLKIRYATSKILEAALKKLNSSCHVFANDATVVITEVSLMALEMESLIFTSSFQYVAV